MKYSIYDENNLKTGSMEFLKKDLSFEEKLIDGETFMVPSDGYGEGYVYQINPSDGLFISVGDWRPYAPMGRNYQVNQLFMEIYFIESGKITLIQNGKKALEIPEGVNLYLNKPSKGRIEYQSKAQIKYISIAIFESYMKKNLEGYFTKEDFSFSESFNWKTHNYNTPEISLIFSQLKKKILSYEKSKMYYESKVFEMLSIISGNFIKEKNNIKSLRIPLSSEDLKRLEAARNAIDKNIINPPDIEKLCKISAMGKTKLRESFKNAYGMPLGGYIRQAKMKHALMLLSNEAVTIQNVAMHLNYASPGKFSAAFKKIYGQSPDEFRKALGI